jgi:hypothetical protein
MKESMSRSVLPAFAGMTVAVALQYFPVIASEATQSIARHKGRMDCFAALAMTWKKRGLHPSRRRFAPPQDEVSGPHGEERAFARVSNHEATTPSAKYFRDDNG